MDRYAPDRSKSGSCPSRALAEYYAMYSRTECATAYVEQRVLRKQRPLASHVTTGSASSPSFTPVDSEASASAAGLAGAATSGAGT